MAIFYWVIKCDCKTITCSTLCTHTHTNEHIHKISRWTHHTILCTHKIMHAFLMNLYYQIKSNQINKPWYSFMYLDPLLLSPLYIHMCVCMFRWIYVTIFIMYRNFVCPLDHTGWWVGIQTIYTHISIGCLVFIFIVAATVVSVSVFSFVCLSVWSYSLLLIVCKPSFHQ